MVRHSLVIGCGISGLTISEALLKEGKVVTLIDAKKAEELAVSKEKLEELSRLGCNFIFGTNYVDDIKFFDEVIISPGVPLDINIVKKAKEAGIPVVGELEWAWQRIKSPVVAITGTNGKTTVTEIVGAIFLKYCGDVFVGGNIGTPLSSLLLQNTSQPEVVVLEVSSFQLDSATEFSPDVFVVLNITEDHLDRYESFSSYAMSKMSPILRQKGNKWAVLNRDDKEIMKIFEEEVRAGRIRPERVLFFSRFDPNVHGFIDGDLLKINLPSFKPILERGVNNASFELTFSFRECNLKGKHNQENMTASALACLVSGVPWHVIEDVLKNFKAGSHRIEWVDNVKGIDFYNDSKATNVDAVVRALEMFEGKPLWLLMGGRDKGGSYVRIWEKARKLCKGIAVFGEAKSIILSSMKDYGGLLVCSEGDQSDGSVIVKEASNLEEAFLWVVERAKEGDVVLLSPACSSFDQYRSYAERGEHFRELVRRFKAKGRLDG